MVTKLLLTLTIAAALLIAGCGTAGDDAVERSSTTEPAITTRAPTAEPARESSERSTTTEPAITTTSTTTTTTTAPPAEAMGCQDAAESYVALQAIEYEIDTSEITVLAWEIASDITEAGVRACNAEVSEYGEITLSGVLCANDIDMYWMGTDTDAAIKTQIEDCQILLKGLANVEASYTPPTTLPPGHTAWVMDEVEEIREWMTEQAETCASSADPASCVYLTFDEACLRLRDLQRRARGTASQDLADLTADRVCQQ